MAVEDDGPDYSKIFRGPFLRGSIGRPRDECDWNNPEFVLDEAEKNGNIMTFAGAPPQELHKPQYHHVCAQIVAVEPRAFANFSAECRKDKELSLAASKIYGLHYKDAVGEARTDRECVIEAVSKNGSTLQYVPDEFRNDPGVVGAAIGDDGSAIRYASGALRENREIVLMAVKSHCLALEYVPEHFRSDREVALTAIGQCNSGLDDEYEKLHIERGLDDEFAKVLGYKRTVHALQLLPDEFKADKDIVLASVRQNGMSLQYASDDLRRDKDVVLAAVKESGAAARFAMAHRKNESVQRAGNRMPLIRMEGVDDFTNKLIAWQPPPEEKDEGDTEAKLKKEEQNKAKHRLGLLNQAKKIRISKKDKLTADGTTPWYGLPLIEVRARVANMFGRKYDYDEAENIQVECDGLIVPLEEGSTLQELAAKSFAILGNHLSVEGAGNEELNGTYVPKGVYTRQRYVCANIEIDQTPTKIEWEETSCLNKAWWWTDDSDLQVCAKPAEYVIGGFPPLDGWECNPLQNHLLKKPHPVIKILEDSGWGIFTFTVLDPPEVEEVKMPTVKEMLHAAEEAKQDALTHKRAGRMVESIYDFQRYHELKAEGELMFEEDKADRLRRCREAEAEAVAIKAEEKRLAEEEARRIAKEKLAAQQSVRQKGPKKRV